MTGFTPYARQDGLTLFWQQQQDGEGLFIPRVHDAAANRIAVSVWGWRGEAVDQGDEAAEFTSDVLRRAVRLVELSRKKPRFVENNPTLGRVGFADGFPLLIFSRESVAEVNRWLAAADKPLIPADRFRGNIILDGLGAFEEDFIEKLIVEDDDGTQTAELVRAKPCGRCPMPDTDQETGERRPDVRSVLGKKRNGTYTDPKYEGKEIFFGQNFIIRLLQDLSEGKVIPIRQGQKLTAVKSSETNWRRAA